MSISTNVNKSVPCNFELVLPILPTTTRFSATEELRLNVFGSIIPSITLEDFTGPWLGGQAKFQSGRLNFDAWNVNFVVDSELRNWKVLLNWIFFINNNKDVFGQLPSDYVVDASLRIIDNFGANVMVVNFKNVWPQTLGEVSLSMREGESNLESSVTFMYDRFEIV